MSLALSLLRHFVSFALFWFQAQLKVCRLVLRAYLEGCVEWTRWYGSVFVTGCGDRQGLSRATIVPIFGGLGRVAGRYCRLPIGHDRSV